MHHDATKTGRASLFPLPQMHIEYIKDIPEAIMLA